MFTGVSCRNDVKEIFCCAAGCATVAVTGLRPTRVVFDAMGRNTEVPVEIPRPPPRLTTLVVPGAGVVVGGGVFGELELAGRIALR